MPGAQQPCGDSGGNNNEPFGFYKPPFIGGSAAGSGPSLAAHFTVDLTGIGANEHVVAVHSLYSVGGAVGNFTLQDTGNPGGVPQNQDSIAWLPETARTLAADLNNAAFPVDVLLTFDGSNATLAVFDFTVLTLQLR